MMKKIAIFLSVLVLFACSDTAVEKPDQLISEDKMVDIFYDLAVLDAMRTQKPLALSEKNINVDGYIYKKYDIDSLQFAQSNRYYASEIKLYKKMYERVGKRLRNNIVKIDPSLKKPDVAEDKKEDN